MNKAQREVAEYLLDKEERIIRQLERQYQLALEDVEMDIRILLMDEQTPSRIHRVEYQRRLKKQIETTLETLHRNEYKTINAFLQDSYKDSFVGTMYDLHSQGVPVIVPIDQNAAVKAIQLDTQLSDRKIHPNANGEHVTLYESLGVDVDNLKETIRLEITRGLATNMQPEVIARNIANLTKAPLSRAKTIARTEAHRIQQASAQDAREKAISRGANVVKQWDATMDGATRKAHRELDGKIVEVNEPFVYGSLKAMYPGDFGDPSQDCNCRCVAVQRARWALGEEELEEQKRRAEAFGLGQDEAKKQQFKDYEKKYLKAAETEKETPTSPKTIEGINEQATEALLEAYDARREHFGMTTVPADELRKSRINPLTANYTGLSVQTAEGFNDTIMRLSDEYYTGLTRIEVANPKDVFGSRSFANIQHNDHVGDKTLVINPLMTKDYDKMIERIDELSKNGYAVKLRNGKAREYIATHEFAHSLFRIGDGSYKNYVGIDVKLMRKIRKEMESIFAKYTKEVGLLERGFKALESKMMLSDDIGEMTALRADAVREKAKLDIVRISKYSLQSADEFMAEAFTQFHIGEQNSPYTIELMAVIDKYFKK